MGPIVWQRCNDTRASISIEIIVNVIIGDKTSINIIQTQRMPNLVSQQSTKNVGG